MILTLVCIIATIHVITVGILILVQNRTIRLGRARAAFIKILCKENTELRGLLHLTWMHFHRSPDPYVQKLVQSIEEQIRGRSDDDEQTGNVTSKTQNVELRN